MTVIAATPEYTASAGYAPPQWFKGPAMISVTQAPVQGASNMVGSASGSVSASDIEGGYLISGSGSTQFTYVFDAVFSLDHTQRLEKTMHPVQTGASISSHAYLLPARLSMDVGMSDVMAAYATGQLAPATGSTASTTPSTAAPFTGAPSKSVSAYQTILSLQSARQPLTIVTRLRAYTNMVVTEVSPQENAKTITGLRMRVEFEQIYTASTATTPLSARPDTTQTTGLGVVSPSSVPSATQGQFQIPQAVSTNGVVTKVPVLATPATSLSAAYGLAPIGMVDYLPQAVNVPGSGSYSSSPGQQALP